MGNDLHYKYVNTIRKPDGSLRDWDEHTKLTQLENSLDSTHCVYTIGEEKRHQKWKHILVDKENEKR